MGFNSAFKGLKGMQALLPLDGSKEVGDQLRWSRGSVLAFGTQVRGFRTRPKPSDF